MKLLILMLFANSVFAGNGNEVGNGGDAVICRGKVPVLLDYYERKNFHHRPIKGKWKKQVSMRITSIKKWSPRLSSQFLNVLKKIDKRLLFKSNTKFRDIKDSFEVDLRKDCKIEQVAIRQSSPQGIDEIHINKDLWDKMEEGDRAGLILHEIVYEHFIALGEKNSIKARDFVRFMSSVEAHTFKKAEWKRLLHRLKLPLY